MPRIQGCWCRSSMTCFSSLAKMSCFIQQSSHASSRREILAASDKIAAAASKCSFQLESTYLPTYPGYVSALARVGVLPYPCVESILYLGSAANVDCHRYLVSQVSHIHPAKDVSFAPGIAQTSQPLGQKYSATILAPLPSLSLTCRILQC